MCLILFALQHDARYPLVVAANRDEFYDRPSEAMHVWPEFPFLLGGKDLVHGGMWFGATRCGKLAMVTNVRRRGAPGGHLSRGHLVRDYLLQELTAAEFVAQTTAQADAYAGFNLLLGNLRGLYYYSNRGQAPQRLEAGIHGLSNAGLDTPWPKVERGKAALAHAFSASAGEFEARLFELLADPRPAPDEQLPDTGYGRDWERLLSPAFIQAAGYGTRSSTILVVDGDGKASLCERSFDGGRRVSGERRFEFDWSHLLQPPGVTGRDSASPAFS
jgi:uncharacterized protein with NRDE domain